MGFYPILQELFESDSIIVMLIGLALAVCVGIKMNDARKNIISLVSSIVLYVMCEFVSNLHTSYMVGLVLLFAGTIAIGGIVGFLISLVVVNVRKR